MNCPLDSKLCMDGAEAYCWTKEVLAEPTLEFHSLDYLLLVFSWLAGSNKSSLPRASAHVCWRISPSFVPISRGFCFQDSDGEWLLRESQREEHILYLSACKSGKGKKLTTCNANQKQYPDWPVGGTQMIHWAHLALLRPQFYFGTKYM